MYLDLLNAVTKSFIALFVIINPIGNLTMFIGLAKGLNAKKRTHIVNRAMWIASLLLVFFIFTGSAVFKLFNIGMNSFMIGGGILLLIIAVIYVLDIHTKTDPKIEDDIAAVPMATPFLIGPGTITSAVLLVSQFGILGTVIGAAGALVAVWIILRFSNQLYNFLGPHWASILSRLMGIFLAAIAIEFVKNGIINIIRSI
jgi:multiple antibiotic resistance protein